MVSTFGPPEFDSFGMEAKMPTRLAMTLQLIVFFAIGGQSIAQARLTVRISEKSGKKVRLEISPRAE
jgi:hypothetical protein